MDSGCIESILFSSLMTFPNHVNVQTHKAIDRSSFRTSVLQRIDTPLNAVQEDVAALEVRINAPASKKLNRATFGIISRVAVKEADLFELRTSGILFDGSDIHDAEATAVVGLVREAFEHVLVVVDGFDGRLVNPGMLGFSKIADIEDISCSMPVGGLPSLVQLVELVIKQQIRHVLHAGKPALMSVARAHVGSLGDLHRGFLVGHIDDGQRILVVVEADLASLVLLVGPLVDGTLCCDC